jgi:hypothetical protein
VPINKNSKNIRQKDQDVKQMEIIELFGKINFDPKYDYKVQRIYQNAKPCHSREGGNPEK